MSSVRISTTLGGVGAAGASAGAACARAATTNRRQVAHPIERPRGRLIMASQSTASRRYPAIAARPPGRRRGGLTLGSVGTNRRTAMATKRTTQRSSSGKKLYAVRAADGKFKDIQSYKRAQTT